MYIKLESKVDIAEFVYVALGYPDAITASIGKYTFNAKYMCNLYAVEGQIIYVHMETQESDLRRDFYKKISKWRVE